MKTSGIRESGFQRSNTLISAGKNQTTPEVQPRTLSEGGPSNFMSKGLGGSGDLPDVDEPLQGFGDYEKHTEETRFEGQCFLKTKTDRYKEHWAVLTGNDLYCYRQREDKEHRVMHSMIGTFIKEMAPEALSLIHI